MEGPEIPEHILHGDMPGDKVEISQSHIKKAAVIFPELLKLVKSVWKDNPDNRAVVTVCGGSGVGKSEIASLLSFFFRKWELEVIRFLVITIHIGFQSTMTQRDFVCFVLER